MEGEIVFFTLDHSFLDDDVGIFLKQLLRFEGKI